jgi:MoxR-like ATPase
MTEIDDFFPSIVGYNDVKEFILCAIFAQNIVNILLVGKPATAKTLFLEECRKLKNSVWVTGSKATKAGIVNEILFNDMPDFLLFDEIDKCDPACYGALLDLMENGRVTETKYHRRREIQLNCKVFATANRTNNMPEELLSRFVKLYFREYSIKEYIEIARVFLARTEFIDEELAEYIARKTVYWKNCRVARSIARMSLTKEDVDRYVAVMKRYKNGPQSQLSFFS